MKKFIVLFISLIIVISAWSQAYLPIERKIGKLHISVDPRIELLSTIQVISGYKNINRNSAYSKEIADYFRPYSSNRAVIMTDDLENKNKFMYATPVQFILDLSALPELNPQTDYSVALIKRVGGKETLDNYRTAIVHFAKESNFENFWKSKETFYNKILELTFSDMAGVDLVKIVEDYFREEQNSYNIIISPLAYASYSCKIEVSDNKYDIYSCNVPRDYKNEIPYIKKEVLLRNATHEFSHSFVNYLTDKYSKKVSESEILYEPIKSAMNLQAYSSWKECINEHIVRAINIRIHQLNWDSALWQKMLNEEKANQFIYIEPVLNKLREFETARNKSNITFSGFYPQILEMFDSLKTANQNALKTNVLPKKE
jgi:hypothetical protein